MPLPVRRALLSVSDKTGLIELARALTARGVEILSTGGTAKLLAAHVDDAVMAQHGIAPIDLLVVNLYPFGETVARPDSSYEEAIENIDVGGPAMLRAAAKNHESVLVVVDPQDYPLLLQELDSHGGGRDATTRARFAAKAFAHTARYDTMVAAWLAARSGGRSRTKRVKFSALSWMPSARITP